MDIKYLLPVLNAGSDSYSKVLDQAATKLVRIVLFDLFSDHGTIGFECLDMLVTHNQCCNLPIEGGALGS